MRRGSTHIWRLFKFDKCRLESSRGDSVDAIHRFRLVDCHNKDGSLRAIHQYIVLHSQRLIRRIDEMSNVGKTKSGNRLSAVI